MRIKSFTERSCFLVYLNVLLPSDGCPRGSSFTHGPASFVDFVAECVCSCRVSGSPMTRFQAHWRCLTGRCGKPSCHCVQGDGHPLWTLTFMAGGKKRVETIPADWLDVIRPRVEAGRRFKEVAAELLLINAELLVLARNQRSRTSRRPGSQPP